MPTLEPRPPLPEWRQPVFPQPNAKPLSDNILERARRVVFKPKSRSAQEKLNKQNKKKRREIHLPNEIWLNVLGNDNLNQYDLACVARVNKQLYALTSDGAIWSENFTNRGLTKMEWTRQANGLQDIARNVLRDQFRVLNYETDDMWWHKVGESLYLPMYCEVSSKPDMSALLREHARKMLDGEADLFCKHINSGSFDEANKSVKVANFWIKKLPQAFVVNKLKPSLFLELYEWNIKKAEHLARKGHSSRLDEYLDKARLCARKIPARDSLQNRIMEVKHEGNVAELKRMISHTRDYARLGNVKSMMISAARAKTFAATSEQFLPCSLPSVVQYGRHVRKRLKQISNHLDNANSEAKLGPLSGMKYYIALADSLASKLSIDWRQVRQVDLAHIFPLGTDINGIRTTGFETSVLLETAALHKFVASGEVLEMNKAIVKIRSYLGESNVTSDLTPEDLVTMRKRGYKRGLKKEIQNAWSCTDEEDLIGMSQAITKVKEYAKWLNAASFLTNNQRQQMQMHFDNLYKVKDVRISPTVQLRGIRQLF